MKPPEEMEEGGYGLLLTVPPSLNNRMFCAGRRMVLSKKYRQWKREAVVAIQDAFDLFDADYLPTDARYRVTIFFSFRDKKRRDIDGFAKPILDAITEAGVAWDDDSQVDQLVIYRYPPGKNESFVLFETLEEDE